MIFNMADENVGVISDEELRNDAPNLLPIEPGKVVIPSGNDNTTRELRKEGVDVIEADMSEFVKGGGGPTCITLPLIRDSQQHSKFRGT